MLVNNLKLDGPGYPEILKRISSPPKELFWAGKTISTWINKPKIAIVGSRRITPYGRAVTREFASGLAKRGVVVISGLAYGVDIAAHQAALEAGGTSVAVLTSLASIYPAAHVNTARQITENGTLITENGPGSETYKSSFVARNRIVSGLADVLLITEAALKSGSLHTARFALEQNKTVMAVPGNINNTYSEGCNNLIKSGAIPVTSLEDILFALKFNPTNVQIKSFKGSVDEELVFRLIQEGVSDQDQLAFAAQLDGPKLSSTLTMLELGGYIRPLGAGGWVIA